MASIPTTHTPTNTQSLFFLVIQLDQQRCLSLTCTSVSPSTMSWSTPSRGLARGSRLVTHLPVLTRSHSLFLPFSLSSLSLSVCLPCPLSLPPPSPHLSLRSQGRWGRREIIYLSLHCHHQNDSCVKMGSSESHFNVSLIVRDRVTWQCPQTTTFDHA